MSQTPRSPPGRLTESGLERTGTRPAASIGFLTDWLDHNYHWRVLRGAIDAAYERGANLLAFVGGRIPAAPNVSATNWVFELAKPTNVDGLVLLSGSLGNVVGSEGLLRFAQGYSAVPMCSVALPLAGMSSVSIDNAAGIRKLVEHLIRTHGITRIAFVRGPSASDEAHLRLSIYREVLEANGVPYAPELVVPGDFMHASGKQAVTTLFVDRKLPVSAVGAIVAANDSMALGAMDELRRQGIKVPDQVAVVGFDDSDESRFVLPPLTTAAQPLHDLGGESVRIVLEHLRDRGQPQQATRPTELVVRRSCGCLHGRSAQRKSSAPPLGNLSFDAALLRRKQQILADLARAGRGELGVAGSEWEVRVLSAAAEQIRGESADAFMRVFDDIVRRALLSGVRSAICSDVLSVLRARLVRCIGDPGTRAEAEAMFDDARVMMMNAVEGVHVEAQVQLANEARSVVHAGAAILAARNIEELARVVHEHVPSLGIPRCFIVRLADGPDGGMTARVLIAERPEARASDPILSIEYSATDVLRRVVLQGTDQRAFAVFPTRFADSRRGLVVLEIGTLGEFAYEAVRRLFSAALGRMSSE
jgi:DNA-binding LacI/PurR family transcriptional regulator